MVQSELHRRPLRKEGKLLAELLDSIHPFHAYLLAAPIPSFRGTEPGAVRSSALSSEVRVPHDFW